MSRAIAVLIAAVVSAACMVPALAGDDGPRDQNATQMSRAFGQSATGSGSPLGTQGDHVRPAPECMCRLRSGERVPLGTRTCIRVGGREYVAECRLAGNVSAWREVTKGCPVS